MANKDSGSGGRPDKNSNYVSPKDQKYLEKGIRHPFWHKFGFVVAVIALFFIFTAFVAGGYCLHYMLKFVNGDASINLDEYKQNQSQTTIMYTLDGDGNEIELARLHGEENRIWVDLDDIPENLQHAYVALEDKRFYDHNGVDWLRTISVIAVYNFQQGGSTITQQLIKNLTGQNGRTFVRKYNEILNALNVEKHYSKDTILEAYLNTLYLDGGCYGVQTAAEYYFGKNVSELNLAECASIAAITQAPYTYDPLINPDNNRTRQLQCLKDMLDQGYITQKEYDDAVNYKMVFTNSADYVESESAKKKSSSEKNETETIQSYYIDYVIDQVIDDLMNTRNYTYSDAWRLVYYGGLKIHVAQDTSIQSELEKVYYNREGFPSSKNSYGELVQSSMVVMDYSGRVLGIVGQAGEKTMNRNLNIATQSRRQPGSSIKPLSVYSLAINSDKYTWSYPLVQNYGILVNGERWPQNYGGDPGSPYSYITIQKALAPSYNTVPAQILKDIGTDKSYNWLKTAFHFTSLEEADNDYAPLAVGAMTHGVYGIEMAAGFATFGNGGKYYAPYSYYTVTNSDNSIVYLTHSDDGEQVMDKGTAEVMNKLLQTVVTESNGTGRQYGVTGFETFAKTGTTTDEKDRWFIGGTPYYVAAVWFGYAEHPEALDYSVNYCGRTFQTVMNDIHEGLESKSFEFDDEIEQDTFCYDTGLLASRNCYNTGVGWYKTDNVPGYCSGGGSSRKYASTTSAATTAASDENTTKQSETTTQAAATTQAATTTARNADNGQNDAGQDEN